MLNFVAAPVTVDNVEMLRRKSLQLPTTNRTIRKKNRKLVQMIEELEHFQTFNNLEIKGIPDGSHLVAAIITIGQVLDEPVLIADING